MIEFGEWQPDQSDLGNKGVLEATNVIPGARGYRPARGMSTISNAADAYIRGIYATRKQDDTIQMFAGDATKLYKFAASDSDLDSVSTSGNYTLGTEDTWEFVQFGNSLVAASGHNQALQEYNIESSSNFDPISGAPAAKYIAVVRDFIITANVKYGGTVYNNRVYFGGINSVTDWTIGTNQTDIQDIPDSGEITGIVGGEVGTVFLQRGIARMNYVGSPIIFTVDRIETNNGCEIPGSIAALGSNAIFYLSPNGFYLFNGSKSVPIGAEKVDQFFFDDLNPAFHHRVSSTVDPTNQTVLWSYASNASATGDPDKIIIYNYAVNRWSIMELEHESLAKVMIPGYTLEQLDNINSSIDAHTTSFDSAMYDGSSLVLGGSKDKKIHSFTGSTLAATITTKEFEVAAMRSSVINSVIPYVTSKNPAVQPTLTVSVGSRNRQVDAVNFTTASSLNDDNFCHVRTSGRYHRVKVQTTGDFRYALGVDVDAKRIGRR